jgi:hypothetical protein
MLGRTVFAVMSAGTALFGAIVIMIMVELAF